MYNNNYKISKFTKYNNLHKIITLFFSKIKYANLEDFALYEFIID